MPMRDSIFIGEYTYTFDNEYIHTEGKGYKVSHSWDVVKRLAKTNDCIYS